MKTNWFTLSLSFHDGTQDVQPNLAVGYAQMINDALSRPEGQGLFGCTAAEIEQPDMRVYAVTVQLPSNTCHLVAGLRCHDAAGEVCFSGAIVVPEFRGFGLMSRLIAQTRCAEFKRDARRTHRCLVRIYRDGRFNSPSLRAFLNNGFIPSQVLHKPLEHSPRDLHLLKGGEDDGSVRSLEMRALPASITAARMLLI